MFSGSIPRSMPQFIKNVRRINMTESKNLFKVQQVLKNYNAKDLNDVLLKLDFPCETKFCLFSNEDFEIDLLRLQPNSFYHNPFSTVVKILEGDFHTELDMGFNQKNPTFNLQIGQTVIISQQHIYHNKSEKTTAALTISKNKNTINTPLL